MKGDFSRDTFRPERHFTGVLHQQGRVQLDADFNEQQAIQQHRTEIEARDVIGRCGGPREHAGFALTTDGQSLRISEGRYYVDGILCQNDAPIGYHQQPHLIDRQTGGAAPQDLVARQMAQAGARFAVAYLDVWERHVTPLEDPALREPALGEADTTTRRQTVWQVRILPLRDAASNAGTPQLNGPAANALAEQLKAVSANSEDPELRRAAATWQRFLARAQEAPSEELLQTGEAMLAEFRQQPETAALLKRVEDELGPVIRRPDADQAPAAPGCGSDLPEWHQLVEPASGRLHAQALPGFGSTNPCERITGQPGFKGPENQLYRVEIHDPGSTGAATFKWSRDNGTLAAAITALSGNVVTVADLGRDAYLGFAQGQWVEILDDLTDLNGLPGQLAQIREVRAATREIVLEQPATPLAPAAPGVHPHLHPRLRRWDQVTTPPNPASPGAAAAGVTATTTGVVTSTEWTPLEEGLEIQFSSGNLRSGDYWLIPARAATGSIDWPHSVAQPPRGIRHHLCRLAILELQERSLRVVEDCRHLFCPLVETPCAGQKAAHVVAINWQNDAPIAPAVLLEHGLRITLDTPPDPRSVGDHSVMVHLEVPYRISENSTTPSPYLQWVLVKGSITVDPRQPRVIVWKLDTAGDAAPAGDRRSATRERTRRGARPASATSTARDSTLAIASLNTLTHFAATNATNATAAAPAATTAATSPRAARLRLRVTLKGHFLWSENRRQERIHLDGQAFGQPVTVDGGQTRVDLALPSGAGARASDFESWFFLGGPSEQPGPAPLTVTRVDFRSENNLAAVVATASYPAQLGQPVAFPLNRAAPVGVVDITFSRPVQAPPTEELQRQPVLIETTATTGPSVSLMGRVTLVEPTVLRFACLDPRLFPPGRFRMTVLGTPRTDPAGIQRPAVVAADNNAPLDGDYDKNAGGDFLMEFQCQG